MSKLQWAARIVFFPLGVVLLAGTAILELIADADWDSWRRYNRTILKATGLDNFFGK